MTGSALALLLTHYFARGQQLRPGGPMNSAINPAAAEQ